MTMPSSTLTVILLLSSFTHLLQFTIANDFRSLFINCGSSTSASVDDRTFVPDIHPRGFTMSGRGTHTIENKNASSPDPLCRTARVFTEPSTYDIDIPPGVSTYILRFHFCTDSLLPNSDFNVSASGHLLLAGFNPGRDVTESVRIIKEFFITVDTSTGSSKLGVYIRPSKSSLAYMNALEVLFTEQNITEATGTHLTSSGNVKSYKGPKYRVLETIYRINVGGQEVDDSYYRSWAPDDRYLINPKAVEDVDPYTTDINYSVSGAATRDDAPRDVYSTARHLNGNYMGHVNPTWKFNVSEDNTFFVRVHFCDIVSPALGEYMFNLYVDNQLVRLVYPEQQFQQLAVPFYYDYIIDSGDNGILNISIGAMANSVGYIRSYPFLNGLEIMQVKNETGPTPEPSGGGSGSRLGLVAGLSVAGVALLIIVLVVVVVVCRKKRKTKPVGTGALQWAMVPLKQGTGSNNIQSSHRSASNHSNLSNLHLHLKIPFLEIQQVTKNFDESMVIGEGGFGKVYRGVLKDGREVAVKRSNPDHGQGFPEFQAEITILSKIRHRHLVSLVGYCNENNEMILVYEFMEKGTLREHLYGPGGSTIPLGLTWQQRLEICIGAAKGLAYLHTGSDSGIIHRDVKSTNILLDKNNMAKVADFGLSRLGQSDESQVITDVKGTYGYLDPEYFHCMQLTQKSDVYSFGVVLLEVLCAKPVIHNQMNLSDWAMRCYRQGQLEDIIDPELVGHINQNSLKRFIEAAEKCLIENAAERPPMTDVCWDLEYALELQRTAAQTEVFQDDSMADASFSVPVAGVGEWFQSGSYTEMDDDLVGMETTTTATATGEVFFSA